MRVYKVSCISLGPLTLVAGAVAFLSIFGVQAYDVTTQQDQVAVYAESAPQDQPHDTRGIGLTVTSSRNSPYGNPHTSYLRQPFGVLRKRLKDTSPVMDNLNEPFGYYRNPRAALGVFGGVENTMITPKGDLRTDFGTLLFYIGKKLTPLDQRIKTWRDGWLPIGEVSSSSGGVSYHFEYFDSTVHGVTKIPVSRTYGTKAHRTPVHGTVDNIVTFVKITATNTGKAPQTAGFGIGLGSRTITNPVFRGPARPSAITFDSTKRALIGSGKLLFTVSVNPSAIVGGSNHVLSYQMTLGPGASRSIVVKLPYWIAQAQDLCLLRSASYSKVLSATERFWREELAHTGVLIPEKKVEDAYKASVVALLDDALNIIGDHWFLTANPTGYKNFFIRDAAFHIDALLKAGLPDVVRNVLAAYPAWQRADGRYVGRLGEFDSNGEGLWAIGRYYEVTRDRRFARQFLPSVKAAMAWQWRYRKKHWAASGGLYPVSQIADDEEVRGHIVGFNLWAIAGGRAAVILARGAGDSRDAAIWSTRMQQYTRILMKKLKPEFERLHVISPATEGMYARVLSTGWYGGQPMIDGWYGDVYGIDWGNMQLVWPGEVFSPDSPMVVSSLRMWRKKMFEGMMVYPQDGSESFLHAYAPLSIPEAAFRGGDQLDALRYLYNELAHTSSMDMTSEGINAAGRWGWSRSTTTMPHNEFSAEYVSLVRDMLAYGTYNGTLHLANVYSPAWTRAGQNVAFAGPTRFGPTKYKIAMAQNGMTVDLAPPTRDNPTRIVISSPEHTEVTGVRVAGNHARNGQEHIQFKGNHITLFGETAPITLDVSWRRKGTLPAYSFHRAVQDFRADYQQMTLPPNVSVRHLTVSARGAGQVNSSVNPISVQNGTPVTISAVLVNHGGAGWLTDPVISLYVDGKPSQRNRTALARGVGFDTPSDVISFRHHLEGHVPVAFAVVFRHSGKHIVGIALGTARPPHTMTVDVQ